MLSRPRVATRAAAALMVTGVTTAQAHAAEGSAPVTAPDRLTVVQGVPGSIDVLANDTDADGDGDGDDLAVCRFGDLPRGMDVMYGEPVAGDTGEVMVFAMRPGTYTLTYYACDFEHLTPGTLTVVVKKAPRIKLSVTKTKRPGHLRVVNRSGFPVQFMWGSIDAKKPDGRVRLTDSTVVDVRRRSVIWLAFARRSPFPKVGIVRGIALPKGTEALPPGAPQAGQFGGPGGSGSGGTEELLVTVAGRVAPAWRHS